MSSTAKVMLAVLYVAGCLATIVSGASIRSESAFVRNYGTKLRPTLQPASVAISPEVPIDKPLVSASNDDTEKSLEKQPQLVELDTITAPVHFLFRSYSGPLLFEQVHMPAQVQKIHHTRSEEEAQVLSHQVYKPIIHELHEIIQPFRRVTQEIKPVKEEIRTIVLQEEKPQAGSVTLDLASQQPISPTSGEQLQPSKQQVAQHNADRVSH